MIIYLSYFHVYRFIIAGKMTPHDLDEDVLRCTIQIADLYMIFPPMVVDKLYNKNLEIGLQDFKYLLNYGQTQQKVYKEIDFNPLNSPDRRTYDTNDGKYLHYYPINTSVCNIL